MNRLSTKFNAQLKAKVAGFLSALLLLGIFSGVEPAFALASPLVIDCPAGGTYSISESGVVTNGFNCKGNLIIDPRATSIGEGAFFDSDASHTSYHIGLFSVYTGDNVTSIGVNAFKMVTQLETVTISNKTQSIGASAFYESGNLRLLSPGRGLQTFGDYSLYGSTNLVFTIPRGATFGAGVPFVKTTAAGTVYTCGAFQPSGTYLGYGSLTKTQFCIDSIDPATPSSEITLHGIGFINGDVIDLGSETRTAVVIGGDSTTATLDSPYLPTGSPDYVRITHADGGWAETSAPVLACYSTAGSIIEDGGACIGSIVIPEGITAIDANAFLNNRELTGITFPASLTSIGASAFSGTDLSNVVIPDGVTSMGVAAFSDNGADNSERTRHLSNVVIGNGLVNISGDAFYKNYSLTSVTLGSRVETIGFKAFSNTAVETITAPSSLSHIYDRAFELSGLASITFPDNSELNEIGDYAFGSTLLTQISIPDSVTVLGTDVFGDTRIASLLHVNYCRSTAMDAYALPNTELGSWLDQKQRLCPNGSKLSSLARTGGSFSETFDPSNLNYSIPLGYSTLSQEISWEKLEADASVRIKTSGSTVYSDPVSFSNLELNLLPGENTLFLKITSIDGITVDTYTVTINRAPAPSLPRGFRTFPSIISESYGSVLENIAASSDGTKIFAVGKRSSVNIIGRSLNSGITWEVMDAPADTPVSDWVAIASSASGNYLVAVTTGGEVYHYSEASSGLGWVRSTGPDSCPDSWEICSGIASGFSLAMSPDGKYVILGTSTGLAFSDDYGMHFSASRLMTTLPASYYLVSISADGQTMLASTQSDVYLSKDAGANWNPIVEAESESFAPAWMAPNGQDMLIAVPGDGGGIIRSFDAGTVWAPLVSTSAPIDVTFCSLSASYDLTKIIVGSCNGNFAYSFNSGEDWDYNSELGDWYGGLISESDGPIYIFRYGRVGSESGKSSLLRATYLRPLNVTSGSVAGGTEVQISGTDFQSGITVFFGDAVGTVITSTPTSITVQTPAYSSTGMVNVSVVNVDEGSYTLTEAFTYTPAPVVVPIVNNYVEYISVATIKDPKVQKFSIYGGTMEARISNGPGTTELKTVIVVPARAIKSDTTFTLSPGTDSGTEGYQILKLTAVGDDGTSITSFAKPLSITIPAGANGALAAWSIDGFNWTSLPLLQFNVLPAGQADGYFINEDGSVTLLTRHLTSFGLRKAQSLLLVDVTSTEIELTSTATLKVTGGSGDGIVTFTSDSPAVCSVSSAGLVEPVTSGSCLIAATKAATGVYSGTSSKIELTILAPVEVKVPTVVVTPAKTIKSVLLSAKATSSNKSIVKVNLASVYKNKVVTVEIYSSVKGKSTKVIQTKVKLDGNGDAIFTAKNPNLKGLSGKIKAGNKSLVTKVK